MRRIASFILSFAILACKNYGSSEEIDSVSVGPSMSDADAPDMESTGSDPAQKDVDAPVPPPQSYGECGRNQDCDEGERCIFSECVFEPAECRPSSVTCDAKPPDCPRGSTAAVEDGCWGDCTPLSACNYLSDCDLCRANGQACLRWSYELGPLFQCVEFPEDCSPLACDCASGICGRLACYQVHDGDEVECVSVTRPGSPDPGPEVIPDEGQTGGSGQTETPNPGVDLEDVNEPDFGDDSEMASGGSDEPPPEIVENPREGSYLEGRGRSCGACGWHTCDAEMAVCLADEECSHWHGCVVLCAGLTGEALSECQLNCFGGNRALMKQALDALACFATECCQECGTPCDE